MAEDLSIEQLVAASALNLTDDTVIVQGGQDKKAAIQLYVDLISSLLVPGAVITNGTTTPTGGKAGDVYIRTDTGQFYQNVAGTWSVFFTIIPGVAGNQLFFGTVDPTVTPPSNTNGDVYMNTSSGFFYKRIAGTWTFTYSVANGPAGAQGAQGTNGTNGLNGKTVLSGTINPSNSTDGTDGDFYFNYSTYVMFGPKAAGVWPGGVSLIAQGVIAGGTAGQILAKIDSTDFNTQWIAPPVSAWGTITGTLSAQTDLQAALDAKASLPDGPVSGLGMSISGSNVIIALGTWRIGGVLYSKGTSTTLAYDAQDATLSRYDSVYSDNANTIHIVSGTLSATPVLPAIPGGTVHIGDVLITPTSVTTIPYPAAGYVNTASDQSISGVKTFIQAVHFNGGAEFTSTALFDAGVVVGGGDWYGQLQLRSDGGGTSGAGRIRFSNTHTSGLDYFIQQDNASVSPSSLTIKDGSGAGITITQKNIFDSDGIRFLKTGDATVGTTTNVLTINNSGTGDASGSTFNGSAAKTISYNSIGAQATLVSGTNIKTINSASLLGSSNILLQTPLVAGTDYLAPTGSGAGLTGFTSGQITAALGFTPYNATNPSGYITPASTSVLTNKDLTSGTNTFPTFNQNTTGSAAKWTTARLLAGNSVDGSANVPFANKFIVQGTTDTGLSAAQFLGALGTGLVKNTTSTGVLSIAVAGTDYQAPLTFTGGGVQLSGSNVVIGGTLAINPTTALAGFTQAYTDTNYTFNIVGTGLNQTVGSTSGNHSTITSSTTGISNTVYVGGTVVSYFNSVSGTLASMGSNQAGGSNGIQISATQILIFDNLNNAGAVYAADYSAANASNPRWIADKGYIDRSKADTFALATDANYTATIAYNFIELPVITANRLLTIPAAAGNSGKVIRILNQNTSGSFTWSFTGGTVKDATSTNITTLTNQTAYLLESDGTNWYNLVGGSGSGTVTAIGVTTANGVSGTSSGGTTPNLTITLGAITPTTVNKVTITAPATSATLTLANGSSLITAGAFSTTLTATAATSVTLPTSGTLYGTASGSITSAQLLASLTNATGTGFAVFSASPALTGTPTAPTPATADNSTTIATTAYVQANLTATTVYFSSGTFAGSGTSGSPYTLGTGAVGISNLSATGTPSSTTYLRGDNTWATVSGSGTPANPTASVGLTAVNGSATTYMRSDGAPALSQAIAPTWTGIHTFQTTNTASSGTSSANYGTLIAHIGSQTSTAGFTDVLVNSTGTFGTGAHNLVDLWYQGVSKFSISNTGQILSSAGFNGGNITSGSFNTTVNTSYNSIFLTNYAPADATHQSLYGPNTIWNFPVWNTTSTTQNYINWKQEARGSGGATPGTTWVLSSSLTTTTTASYTDRLSLDGLTGNLTLSGGLITGGHSTIEGITSTGATGTGKFVFDTSPALTGTPLTPTASPGTNTTQIASTAFVTAAVAAAGGGVTFATPSASIGLTAIPGSATTAMRSDAAPVIDQTIAPSWTGIHTWTVNNLLTATSDIIKLTNTTVATSGTTVQVSPSINLGGTYWTGSASNTFNYRFTAGNAFGNQFAISGQTNGGTWKDFLYIDEFGAFIAKNQFTIQLSNTGTTPTDGLIFQSTTASTSGSPIQWSGRTRFISRVWNTTATAADNWMEFSNEVRPVSGTTPTGKMFWASRLSVSGSGSFVDNMSLDNSGNLRVGTITTSPLSLSAINATATATAAQVASGVITSTSASATTITLPTATLLATQLAAVRGTTFDFVIDNSVGASTVTLVLGTGMTALAIITGSNTLTTAAGSNGVFRLYFQSTTACSLVRLG